MMPRPRTAKQIERDQLETVKSIIAVLDQCSIDDGDHLAVLGSLYAAEALSCACSLESVLNAMRKHYRMVEQCVDEGEETLDEETLQ
jgi:hypothetical protein